MVDAGVPLGEAMRRHTEWLRHHGMLGKQARGEEGGDEEDDAQEDAGNSCGFFP